MCAVGSSKKKKPSKEKICVICDKKFFVKRDKLIKTCSPRCWGKLGAIKWRKENHPELNNKNWLIKKYKLEELPLYEIGGIIGVSGKAIARALKRLKITLRHKSFRTNRTLQKVSGKNNWNWQGGIYDTNKKIRTSPQYRRMRKDVIKRDKFCQWCEETPSSWTEIKFEVDHIKKFSECTYEEKLDPNNCRLLCSDCHKFNTKYQHDIKAGRIKIIHCPQPVFL